MLFVIACWLCFTLHEVQFDKLKVKRIWFRLAYGTHGSVLMWLLCTSGKLGDVL